MFADKKAHRIGDILTVIVSENNGATRNNTSTTSKTSGVDASISSFLYGPANSGFLTKKGQYPAMNFNSKNTFNGGGTIANAETINSSIAVKVIDVLPNNNLVIGVAAVRPRSPARNRTPSSAASFVTTTFPTPIPFIARTSLTPPFNSSAPAPSPTTSARDGFNRLVWDKVSPF